MTIDEAIEHAREVAESRDDMCAECRAEHQQLADWLEELKCYQEQHYRMCDFYEVATVEDIYNKAIDEFLCVLLERETNEYVSINKHCKAQFCEGDCIKCEMVYIRIANKLKDGGKNE